VSRLTERERRYLYWLCCADSVGAVSQRKLYEYFHSFEAIYNIEEKELAGSGILKAKQIESLFRWKKQADSCMKAYEALERKGIRLISPVDEEYPGRLKEIYDYPMGLFVRGSLPEGRYPSVAIVGARGCSRYGEQLAEEFARVLAESQVQVISGLALGIDGAAHRGALRAESGMTYGVLGCGVNICYPSSNYALYEAMIRRGGVLSELPPGTNPASRYFPMRNRIISGLSDAILIVEAKEHSGSLITAELGLEQGREIFAVPGRVTDHLSTGCNHLIAQGAHLANSPDDILECLGIKYQKSLIICEKNVKRLAKREKIVYSCLDFKPRHMDQIVAASGFPVTECMGILLELELNGFVYRSANHYYGKKL